MSAMIIKGKGRRDIGSAEAAPPSPRGIAGKAMRASREDCPCGDDRRLRASRGLETSTKWRVPRTCRGGASRRTGECPPREHLLVREVRTRRGRLRLRGGARASRRSRRSSSEGRARLGSSSAWSRRVVARLVGELLVTIVESNLYTREDVRERRVAANKLAGPRGASGEKERHVNSTPPERRGSQAGAHGSRKPLLFTTSTWTARVEAGSVGIERALPHRTS